MTQRNAYEYALALRKFCKEQTCKTCIFRTGRRGNVMTGCRLSDDNIPEFWELRYAHDRVKKGKENDG